jgi:hypothetical protein
VRSTSQTTSDEMAIDNGLTMRKMDPFRILLSVNVVNHFAVHESNASGRHKARTIFCMIHAKLSSDGEF